MGNYCRVFVGGGADIIRFVFLKDYSDCSVKKRHLQEDNTDEHRPCVKCSIFT